MSTGTKPGNANVEEERALEVEEDLPFQRRQWIAQRTGWVLIILVVLSGLAGVFGSGPVSWARAGGEAEGLAIEYERFGRCLAPTQVRFHWRPGPPSEGLTWIEVSAEYLARMEVQEMRPEPERFELAPDAVRYGFRVVGRDEPVSVTFVLEPAKAGRANGWARRDDRTRVQFGHWVYP